MKICTKCKKSKEETEFSKNSYWCKNCEKEYAGKYYKNNIEKIEKQTKEYMKEYKENNKEKIREQKKGYNKKYKKTRMKADPLFKFKENIRNLIRQSFKNKGFKKNSKTEKILGCSFEEFRKYIEGQLPVDKSLKNLGYYGYHIDHRIALATAETEEDIIRLCHYTNLQPLWWKDNLVKSAKQLLTVGGL